MRRYILIMLIVLMPAISFGGDYEPLLKEGKWWHYGYYNVFSNNYIFQSLEVGNEFEIDDKIYKIIYDDVSQSGLYALHEEDKKVYCVFFDDGTPQLIYDFDKNEGEIVSEEIEKNTRTVVKVLSVDSVKYDDHIFRRMLVGKEVLENEKLQRTDKSVWIEGIGSPYGLAFPFATSDSYIRFYSCQVGGQGEVICENEQFWVDGVPDVTHQKTIDGLKYYLYPDTHDAAINSENTWVGEFDIPSEVSYNDETYAVSGMSCKAFMNCSTLTKVKIPKSIELVIHIPLDDSDRTGALSPDLMNPFTGCTSLESIEVDEDNSIMKSVAGVLFNKDGTRLYAYPAGKKSESYVVPEGVTWIGSGAFVNNNYLISIEFPETVMKLSGGTFSNCKNLEKVVLSPNLTHIGDFYGCSSLKSIEIPLGVKSIEERCFYNCSSLKTIDLPESVSYVGHFAFNGCILDALVIRGILDSECINRYLFYGLNESVKLYVQASEMDRYKDIFPGTILPLEEYHSGILSQTTSTNELLPVYDLNGVRVERPRKGVYIQNGRKVIAK